MAARKQQPLWTEEEGERGEKPIRKKEILRNVCAKEKVVKPCCRGGGWGVGGEGKKGGKEVGCLDKQGEKIHKTNTHTHVYLKKGFKNLLYLHHIFV